MCPRTKKKKKSYVGTTGIEGSCKYFLKNCEELWLYKGLLHLNTITLLAESIINFKIATFILVE